MRRRTLLAVVGGLASLAGCSSPEPSGSTTGGAVTTTTDGSPTMGGGTTTSLQPCSPAQTAFSLPVETRPDPLDAAAARRVATDLERAHVAALDVRPQLFPQLPDGVSDLRFELAAPDAMTTRTVDDGYEVTVHGIARYQRRENGSTTPVEEPLDVAIYGITPRQVARIRGIADLTGTILCWGP